MQYYEGNYIILHSNPVLNCNVTRDLLALTAIKQSMPVIKCQFSLGKGQVQWAVVATSLCTTV